MKSTDMPARYVGGNLVDLISRDNIYIQLRIISVLHKKTKVTRFELIYNVLAHTIIIFEIRHTQFILHPISSLTLTVKMLSYGFYVFYLWQLPFMI